MPFFPGPLGSGCGIGRPSSRHLVKLQHGELQSIRGKPRPDLAESEHLRDMADACLPSRINDKRETCIPAWVTSGIPKQAVSRRRRMNRAANRRISLWARGSLWLGGMCLLGALGTWGWRLNQASWHLRQGQVALQERDFPGARNHFLAYLALRSNSGEGHFLLARACRRAPVEDFSQARQHLQQAQALGWSES